MQRVDICYVKSDRKNDLVEVAGYLFERNQPILLGFSYRCLSYKLNSCPVRLQVRHDGSFLTGTHKHAPCPEDVTMRKIVGGAKQMVKENRLTSTSQVIDHIENEAMEKMVPMSALGSTENLKRRIRHQRYKAHGYSNLGNTLADIDIPVGLTRTVRDTQFLLYDNHAGENRQIIFATMDAIDRLAYCETWLVDGTFKSCPKQFAQIYTIHGVYRDHVSVPFVYAYLPGKSYETYLEFFRTVRRFVPGEPNCIISDFELAAINAAKDTFIASELNGCLFHLTQSIFRQVQHDKELLIRYNSTDDDGMRVRQAVRSLGALAFARKDEVTNAFYELRRGLAADDTVRDVYRYFQNNYLGDDWGDIRFPIKFWNVRSRFLNRQPRTNNAKEGWHFRFNDHHSKSHPTMCTSIQMIRKEEKHYYIECEKINNGFVPGRKRKSIAIDTRLANIVQKHEDQKFRNDTEFLHAVQGCLHSFIHE